MLDMLQPREVLPALLRPKSLDSSLPEVPSSQGLLRCFTILLLSEVFIPSGFRAAQWGCCSYCHSKICPVLLSPKILNSSLAEGACGLGCCAATPNSRRPNVLGRFYDCAYSMVQLVEFANVLLVKPAMCTGKPCNQVKLSCVLFLSSSLYRCQNFSRQIRLSFHRRLM